MNKLFTTRQSKTYLVGNEHGSIDYVSQSHIDALQKHLSKCGFPAERWYGIVLDSNDEYMVWTDRPITFIQEGV